MKDMIMETLELSAPPSPRDLARLIRGRRISKLVINYEFDDNPPSCDYLSRIGDDGKLEDCPEVPVKPFSSPFSGIRLTRITFPIEIGPACTSLRGLFAGQKHLTSVGEIRGTDHVKCFNYLFSDCFHLVNAPQLNLSSAISVAGLYSGCHRLRSFLFSGGDHIENASAMFAYCYNLRTAPAFHFPECGIASSMFEGCIRLTEVPFYTFDRLQDASSMFKDCLLLENMPVANMPHLYNLMRMFANCRSVKHISSYILSFISSGKNVLLLAAFEGCTSLDEGDARYLLDKRPDALLSYNEAVLNEEESRKILKHHRRRHSFLNRHWVSNIVIFTILLLAVAVASMRYWPAKGIVTPDPGKALANSKAKILTPEEATQKAQFKDSSELLSMYSFRCDTRMTFESYLKILEQTINELGRYQLEIYRNGADESTGQFVVVLSNKDSYYISDVIELSSDDKKLILMRRDDTRTLPEEGRNFIPLEDDQDYYDLLSRQQLVVSPTDFFVPEKNNPSFILLRHKYQSIPVDFSDSLFFQYSNSVMLREVDTDRLLVPVPRDGYFYYLDESGQVSDERFGNCFEINEYLYQGLKTGLTYDQARREEAKSIDSDFRRQQDYELDME